VKLILFISLLVVSRGLANESHHFGKYQVDGKKSPAFVIKYRGKSCLVSPRDILRTSKDVKYRTAKGQDLAVVHTLAQRYLSINILESSQIKEDFSFVPNIELKAGDEIFAVGPNGKRGEGKLIFNPGNGLKYNSKMGSVVLSVLTEDKTGSTRLPSGCPVFLKSTGQLIGVVVVRRSVREPYEHFKHPEYFLFQTLCLPSSTSEPQEKIDAIAGIPFKTLVVKDDFRWLLPELAYQIKLGMNKEERSKVLGDKKGGAVSYKDHTWTIRDDTPFLYIARLDSGARGEALKQLTFSGQTNPEIGRFYKAEKLLNSLVASYGPPNLYTDTYAPGGDPQNSRMIMHWMVGQQSLTLHFSYGMLQMSGYLILSNERSNSFIKKVADKHRLSKPPADLNKAYFAWLGKVYKWRRLPDTK